MSENGNGNDDKTKPKRDEKGRFLPGGPGGPGRGKKSELNLDSVDFFDEVANKFLPDLDSKDDATRLKSGKILIAIKKLKDDFERERSQEEKVADVLSPWQMAILKIIRTVKRPNQDLLETAERVQKACSKCDKIGKPSRDFGFDKYDEDK